MKPAGSCCKHGTPKPSFYPWKPKSRVCSGADGKHQQRLNGANGMLEWLSAGAPHDMVILEGITSTNGDAYCSQFRCDRWA